MTDDDVARAFARLDRSHDASLVAAVRNASVPARDDGILYVGLNPESASAERKALEKTGRVRALTEPAEYAVTVKGAKYHLGQPEQVAAFVQTLQLDPRCANQVERAINVAGGDARGKLAQLAAVFAEAERGRPIPSRLVISAHSGGENLYGSNGTFTMRDLQRLATAMPRAAACIEDLHFSACSTSGQAGLDSERAAWRSAFPNLKTLWAYAGSSPLAPLKHLGAWARSTAIPHDTLEIPAGLGRERVAVWSTSGGYRDEIPLATLRTAQQKADTRFAEFVSGGRDAEADSADALADYQAYRVLSQKSDVPPVERAALAQKADQLLRLRYYSGGVRAEFLKRHGALVNEALTALGLENNLGTATRSKAMTTIQQFEEMLAAAQPPPAAAERAAPLLRALRDLDPRVILASDCHH